MLQLLCKNEDSREFFGDSGEKNNRAAPFSDSLGRFSGCFGHKKSEVAETSATSLVFIS